MGDAGYFFSHEIGSVDDFHFKLISISYSKGARSI